MTIFKPTTQQQAAIDYDGSMIITACPGSGKTTVMKEKVRQTTANLPSHKGVIAITFTKKASSELKKKCTYNAHDTKQSFFGTIDSFCLKEIIIPFIGKIWGTPKTELNPIKQLQEPYVHYLKDKYISPTSEDINNDEGFKKLYEEGMLWMNSFAALALYILQNSKAAQRYIKARYSHVFIDEYQDSSLAQHQLFFHLFEQDLIATAVGDVWQSIYEFRGGNSRLLNELATNPGFEHFVVDINHRCHPSIVNYATRLMDPSATLLTHDANDIRVHRLHLKGNLKDIGSVLSTYIKKLIVDGDLGNASDVAILAKKEKSLALCALGMNIDYRLYNDNPLEKSSLSDCTDLYSDLLSFRYGAITTIQDLIDKHFDLLEPKKITIAKLRSLIKRLRDDQSVDDLIYKFGELASLIGIMETQNTDASLKLKIHEQAFLKQFMAKADNEVQIMTLHKSKGLEFKYVFHLDLEEWSFPYMEKGDSWDDLHYPNLPQDTNLHYVGITRAEEYCVLVRAEYRQNAAGKDSKSRESYFWSLPQLKGLYQ
ncbi:UvrD-helicase domain-containing protein [Photobacterium indicum]|uniref:DNA 3'-5' helicase n=1 Tax=Photobacterium indicum TaxID=81447 RepID=A0A2T3LEE2_9GAMM|nr:ATP-dependent helicase [Photobacterium indicum]PSV49744.1 ATP-dependent helicase [Photobacterium indicum]